MPSDDEMVPTEIPSPPQSPTTEIGDGEESSSLPGSPVTRVGVEDPLRDFCSGTPLSQADQFEGCLVGVLDEWTHTLADIQYIGDQQTKPEDRPGCQCACGCRGRPGKRRVQCCYCHQLVGPGCGCLARELPHAVCHLCVPFVTIPAAAACIDQQNANSPRRRRSCHELDDPAVVDMGADELARIGRTRPAPASQGTL